MSQAPDATSTKVDGASVVVALLLAGLAGVIAWDASRLSNNNVYGVGPAAMPYVVAVGLGILAIGNLIIGFREGLPPRESADPKTVLLILGGLAAMIATIGLGGGFIIAMTILFTATSTAFGRRAYLADAGIGFVTGTFIYLAFDRILSLSLPAGPLEQLIIRILHLG